MHSGLTRTTYQHVIGTKFITDLFEVSTILMEYFAKDPRVLKTFSHHYKTGEVINQNILDLMCNLYKNEQVAQMHLKYSPVDQFYDLHSSHKYSYVMDYILKHIPLRRMIVLRYKKQNTAPSTWWRVQLRAGCGNNV